VQEATNEKRIGTEAGATATVVAGYIRVSSRSQDYAYQRHEIERAARARGELVTLWFADVASGSSMQRPNLLRLRAAMSAGKIHRLWVWRLDRLTRSGIVDTLSCIDEMRRWGCEIASVADGFALDGPAAEVILAVLAWAAQLERIKIRENQDAARARMAAEGRQWGHPPLPAEVGERARALGAEGKSVRQIARELRISKTSAWKFLQGAEAGIVFHQNQPETGDLTARPPQKTSRSANRRELSF
jgi:DNA invertase Pin-like site-specific DNA recombinase